MSESGINTDNNQALNFNFREKGVPEGYRMTRAPGIGDVIRTNYGTGGVVVKAQEIEGRLYFEYATPPAKGVSYLNDFVFIDGRCRHVKACAPKTAGFLSNEGGRDGDGYDEIIVLEQPAQGKLF